MREVEQRGVAVFLAAAVLAVTGGGIAIARTAPSPAGSATFAAAPASVAPMTAADLTPAGGSPDRAAAPAAPVGPDGTDVDGADAAADLDAGPDPATAPDDEDAVDQAPADGADAADAGDGARDGGEVVDAVPAAVPVLPGRSASSLLPPLDRDAVDATAAATGIPARALHAYAGVGLRMAEERPGCDVTWVTLAAIGWIESHHGTIDGRRLTAEGSPDRAIVGVPLDGRPGVRAIRDTDGGRWDGDATWDRAVGPMQFIPSTWQRWQVDASGTGTADPQHIDDAALAAARYLCAAGRGSLSDPQAWYRAVFAYNNSDDYVRAVLHTANTYAARANRD